MEKRCEEGEEKQNALAHSDPRMVVDAIKRMKAWHIQQAPSDPLNITSREGLVRERFDLPAVEDFGVDEQFEQGTINFAVLYREA